MPPGWKIGEFWTKLSLHPGFLRECTHASLGNDPDTMTANRESEVPPSRDTPRDGILARLGRIPIAYKLSLVISGLIVGCIGLLAFLIVQHQHQLLQIQLDNLGNTLASQVARSTLEPLLAEDQLALEVLAAVDLIACEDTRHSARLLNHFAIRTPTLAYHEHNERELCGKLVARLQGGESVALISDAGYNQPVVVKNVIAGHVVLTINRTNWNRAIHMARVNIIVASVIALLIGLVLTVYLSRRLSQPIHELLDVSRALHAGNYRPRPLAIRRRDELGTLMHTMNRFAEHLEHKDRIEETLARYLSPTLANEIVNSEHRLRLGGERVQATVLFADIVGFTRLSEGMDPEAVANLLNRYFAHIARACQRNHGIVDKYIGDCAMLVFGVPRHEEEHAFNALCCALSIQALVERENAHRARAGQPPVHFRIGINSGPMLAGNIGAMERMEFTVLGETVNLASRLSSASGAGEILVTEEFLQRPDIQGRVQARPHGAVRLRGFSRPVNAWVIEGLQPEFVGVLEERTERLWWQSLKRTA